MKLTIKVELDQLADAMDGDFRPLAKLLNAIGASYSYDLDTRDPLPPLVEGQFRLFLNANGAAVLRRLTAVMSEVGGSGLDDIRHERLRQIKMECFDAAHDDQHEADDLAMGAAAYAVSPHRRVGVSASSRISLWPWQDAMFKPADRRRELVKAGALIVAAIDRMDRRNVASAPAPAGGGVVS